MTAAPVAIVLGTGQLGREMSLLAPDGLDVKLLGRDAVNFASPQDIKSMFAAFNPGIVLNAAAYTAVDRAETERELVFAVNRDGPAALAAGCSARGIPLIHVSTDYVFDGNAGPYREEDSPSPVSVYGASKLAGEDAIRSRLPRHVILRTSWLFSAFGGNFVKTMLRLGRERSEIRVVDDQHGCPTPAQALAAAMLSLAKRAAQGESLTWGTYHFAGQPATTWRLFAEKIFQTAHRLGLLKEEPRVVPITTQDYPTAARRPANSVLDCRSLAKIGLVPPDWRTGLNETLERLSRANAEDAAR